MSETPDYVMNFLKAVYPEATELSIAFNNEKSCLIDATQRIADLQRELGEAKEVTKIMHDTLLAKDATLDNRNNEIADLKKQVAEKDRIQQNLTDLLHNQGRTQ